MYYYKRLKNTVKGEEISYIKRESQSTSLIDIEITEEEYFDRIKVPSLIKEMKYLKEQLSSTDYIACKIAEGSATQEEYAEQIEERRNIRARINEIELELNS